MKTRAAAMRLRSESRAIRAESDMLRVVANWDWLEPLTTADAKLMATTKAGRSTAPERHAIATEMVLAPSIPRRYVVA